MKKENIEKFKKNYFTLNSILKEAVEIKVITELEKKNLEIKIEKLEDKDFLSEKQEDDLFDYQNDFDEIESNLEQIEEFVDHIEEAMGLICFDLESLEAHTVLLKEKINQLEKGIN